MLFERIERELADGEPWAGRPINRAEWGEQIRDCWEIDTRRTQELKHSEISLANRHRRSWLPLLKLVSQKP